MFLRFIIKALTFPVYVIVLLHYKVIESFFNLTIRSYITSLVDKFNNYRKKRKDKYFATFGIFVLVFYLIYFFKLIDVLYKYTDIELYFDFYYNLYYLYLDYEEIIIKTFYFVIPFVLIEKLIFKRMFSNVDIKPSLNKKYRLRNRAINDDKIFAGTISNKTNDNHKPKLPWKNKVFLSDEQRSLHVDCAGTTGTGKSASFIFPWAYSDIRRGKGCMIIDAKGDIEFFNKLNTYHNKFNDNNQDVKLINLADEDFTNTYNPLIRGNAIELKDRIMDAFPWSEEFYKTRAESTLLTLLQAIENVGKKVTFHDLYLLLTDSDAVDSLKDKVSDDFLKNQLESKILEQFDEVKNDCTGLINNIDLMAHGGIDNVVNTYTPDIDLLECYRNNDIVYITLPTNLIGQTARAFGKMLLMDLRSTAGYIEQKPIDKRFYPVFIDEFAEFATEEFVSWLNKARSSGFAIHLAHQSLGDLEQVNDAFVKQVIDNTNIKMVFRMNDSDSVENYCSQLGTFTTTKETERVSKSLITESEDYMGSLREVDEFIESPNKIKNDLERGQALIFGKHPKKFHCIINTDYLPDPDNIIEHNIVHSSNYNAGEVGLFIEKYMKEKKRKKNKKDDIEKDTANKGERSNSESNSNKKDKSNKNENWTSSEEKELNKTKQQLLFVLSKVIKVKSKTSIQNDNERSKQEQKNINNNNSEKDNWTSNEKKENESEGWTSNQDEVNEVEDNVKDTSNGNKNKTIKDMVNANFGE